MVVLQRLERYIQQYEMSETRPWLLQTFLEGPEFSCYTLAHKGKVIAHVDNVASLSCLKYKHVGIPEVCRPSLPMQMHLNQTLALPPESESTGPSREHPYSSSCIICKALLSLCPLAGPSG